MTVPPGIAFPGIDRVGHFAPRRAWSVAIRKGDSAQDRGGP